MQGRGPKKLVEALKKSCLAPEELYLKQGAVVMFVKNNFDAGYVNGTLGMVEGFTSDGFPNVRTHNGQLLTAYPQMWKIEEEGRVIAQIEQIPLRLAWAITVHKSQGMTLDAARINLTASFVAGMGYVALSRVRSLDGLYLTGINETALEVHPQVVERDARFQEESDMVQEDYNSLTEEERKKRQEEFCAAFAPTIQEPKPSTYEQTRQLIEKKLSLEDIIKERAMTFSTIVSHVEKLKDERRITTKNIERLCAVIPKKKQKKIMEAFEELEEARLTPAKELLGDEYTYDELGLVRLLCKNG
jgi:ATP-dependent exoDNAse (exonuclease V) alpha subunit